MEDDHTEIENLNDALRLIAEGTDAEVSGALYAISNGVTIHLDRAKEKAREIFHVTWAYRDAAVVGRMALPHKAS